MAVVDIIVEATQMNKYSNPRFQVSPVLVAALAAHLEVDLEEEASLKKMAFGIHLEDHNQEGK